MGLQHEHYDCPKKGCFAVVTLHRQEAARLRETHDDFWCPAGHSMSFQGKTPQEKRIEQLERKLKRAEQMEQMGWDYAYAQADGARSLARGAQVCPLGCGWHANRRISFWGDDGEANEEAVARFFDRAWQDLREHLSVMHGATLPEAVGARAE